MPTTYLLRIRTYSRPDAGADVYLIRRDGGAETALLHGALPLAEAEQMAQVLEAQGVAVEYRRSPAAIAT